MKIFGDTNTAKCTHESVDNKNKITATVKAMVKCYVNNKQYADALILYDFVLLNDANIKINDVIPVLAIKAYGFLTGLARGNKIKDGIKNLDNKNTNELKDALIEFYFKCNDVYNAQMMFEGLKHKNIRTNAMIEGLYILLNIMKRCYIMIQLILKVSKRRSFSFFAIKACRYNGNIIRGKQIHKTLNSLLKKIQVAVQNASTDFHGYFHLITNAIICRLIKRYIVLDA